MESGVFLPALDHFMLSPLVTWVSSARGRGCCGFLTHTGAPNISPSVTPLLLLSSQVRTFVPHDGGAHLDFSELLDGVLLNDIMMQM